MTYRFCLNHLVLAALAAFTAVTSTVAAEKTSHVLVTRAPLEMPSQMSRLSVKGALVSVTVTEGRVIAVGERGHVLVSEDNGVNWVQTATPVSVTLTAVSFPNANQGWAVGHAGVVLHTSDGGKTWSRQIDGRTLAGPLAEAKSAALDGNDKPLAEKLQRFIDDGPDKPLLDVKFFDERRGMAVGAYGLLLSTSDGGSSWRVVVNLIDSAEDRHIYAIRKVGNVLYLVGEQGLLYQSNDDGKTFAKMKSPGEGSFFDLIGDSNGLLLLGLRGSLWYTSDSGAQWRRIAVDTKYSFVAGTSLGEGKGFVLADDGGGIWLVSNSSSKPHRLADSAKFPLSSLALTASGNLVAAGLLGVHRAAIAGR